MKKTVIIKVTSTLLIVLITAFFGYADSYYFKKWSNNTMVASSEISIRKTNLPEFRGIKLDGICNVTIVNSDKCAIAVSGPKNFVENLSWNVEQGTLNIKLKKNNVAYRIKNKSEYPEITVYVSELVTLEKNNMGKVSVQGNLNTPNVWIKNNTMSELELGNINCGSLKIELNSAGRISVGNIDARDVTIINDSMGDVKTGDVKCSSLNVKLLGGGSIKSGDMDVNSALFVNKSMGNIIVNSVKCKKKCEINLTSGGDFTSTMVNADMLTCSSTSMGEIKIKNAETRKYSQKGRNGRVWINY